MPLPLSPPLCSPGPGPQGHPGGVLWGGPAAVPRLCPHRLGAPLPAGCQAAQRAHSGCLCCARGPDRCSHQVRCHSAALQSTSTVTTCSCARRVCSMIPLVSTLWMRVCLVLLNTATVAGLRTPPCLQVCVSHHSEGCAMGCPHHERGVLCTAALSADGRRKLSS